MANQKAKKNTKKNEWIAYVSLNEAKAEIHEWIALILLMIMAIQPLQGITQTAYTNNDVIALFLQRAVLIRAVGYMSLLNALVFYIRKIVTQGCGILKDTFIKRPWNSLFLLLLLWSFVCVGHAEVRETAVSGDPVRFEGILSYIAYAGFFAGASLIKNQEHKKTLFVVMGLTATALGMLSLWCYYHPSQLFLTYMDVNIINGLSGTFVNTNHYGYYICVMSTLLFGLAVMVKKIWMKVAFVIFGLFQCVVLLVNNTMGSIIAAILGLCVLLLLLSIRKGGRTRAITLGSLGLVVIVCAAFIVFCVQRPQTNTLTQDVAKMAQDFLNITGLNPNATEAELASAGTLRWGVWKAAVNLIKDHPLRGIGTDNAYYAMEAYYGQPKMPHNEYLGMGVNLGIPGMALYLAALFSLLFMRLPKIRRMPMITVLAGCGAFTYAVSAFFGVSLCTVLPFFYIFLSFFADDTDIEPAIEKPQIETKAVLKQKRS